MNNQVYIQGFFYYSSYFIQLFPKNTQGGRIILDRDTLIFFSDLEFFGYALYAIVYICNTIWYRITRLGDFGGKIE